MGAVLGGLDYSQQARRIEEMRRREIERQYLLANLMPVVELKAEDAPQQEQLALPAPEKQEEQP